MNINEYIAFLHVIEKLKCQTRHSWTSSGRHESVAEHSWRLSVMALLCADAFPTVDIHKVVTMCLIHDLGEAVTGDIPAFQKNEEHEREEAQAIEWLLCGLPEPYQTNWKQLFAEMNARESEEAKLYKALDNMEAILSHNEAPLSTWLPREFEENLTYGERNVAWSEWTAALKNALNEESRRKIAQEKADMTEDFAQGEKT